MTKRESSVEEGGSILQMLAVKGSRKEELHGNYKNTEKKNRSNVGGCFLRLCYEMGSPEGGKVGEKGSGKLVMEKKNQSMIK